MDGISSPNVPLASALDEVLGNQTEDGISRTRRQTIAEHALQIAASEPMQDAFAEETAAREAAIAALTASVDETTTALDGRIDDVEASLLSGIKPAKQSVRLLVTTATDPATMTAGSILDGLVLATNDRVARATPAGAAADGVYVIQAAGAAIRSADMDAAGELVGARFDIEAGTHAAETWALQTPAPVVVETTALTFVKTSSASATTAEVIAGRGSKASIAARFTDIETDLATVVVAAGGVPKVKRYLTMISGTSNVSQTGIDTWSRTAGTTVFIGSLRLTAADIVERDAGRPITLRLPVTGAFSDVPDYQQFTSAGAAIGSRVDMAFDALRSEYWVTYVQDPTAFDVRIRWGATAAATSSKPYILYQGQVAIDDLTTVGARKRVEDLALEVAETSGDLFGGTHWTAGIGALGEISLDQRTVSVPIGSRIDKTLYILGLLAPTDGYTLVLELLEAPSFNISAITCSPDTGLGGGIGTSGKLVSQHGNFLFFQGSAAAAAGAYARYMTVGLDNRNPGVATFVAGNLKVRIHALLRGYIPAYKMTDMAALRRAMAAKANRTGLVSTIVPANANDVYTTVADAIVAGHHDIKITSAIYRNPVGLAVVRPIGLEWYPTTQPSGTSLFRPRLNASASLAPVDLIQTAANALVYFKAMAESPSRVWELVTATRLITRMGIPTSGILTGRVRVATSEAEVQANIGAYWWGNGSEGIGLYFRPFDDTTVGKTWEAPTGVSVLWCINAQVRLSNLVVEYSTGNAVFGRGGEIRTNNMEIGRCGGNGMQNEEGCRYYDPEEPSLFTDAGNDGIGCNSFVENPVHWNFNGTRFEDNNYDGSAPHGTYVVVDGRMRCRDNGKGGFETITAGYYDFDIDSRNNRGPDILLQMGAATQPTVINGRSWIAGAAGVTISHNTPSMVTGKIERVSMLNGGQFTISADVNVGYIEGNGDDLLGGFASTKALYRRDGGTGYLLGGRGSRYNAGIQLTGGTFTLRGGNWLRNSIGLLQSGGVLNLDATNPANFFGNTTQFSGVSAPDQAKTIAVQAAY